VNCRSARVSAPGATPSVCCVQCAPPKVQPGARGTCSTSAPCHDKALSGAASWVLLFSLGDVVASLWVGAVRVRPAGCLPGADAVEDLIDEFCGDRAGLQNGSIEDWSDQQAEASCGSTGLCSSSFVPASSSAACRRWVCEVALDTANASFDAVLVLEAAREWSPRRDWFGAHTRDSLRPR
jgi:hypothetical protein